MNVRFPIPSFKQDDLATFFGIPKVSGVHNGLDGQWLYQGYRRCLDENTRHELKTKLIEYNLDDIKALVGIAKRMARLRFKVG